MAITEWQKSNGQTFKTNLKIEINEHLNKSYIDINYLDIT